MAERPRLSMTLTCVVSSVLLLATISACTGPPTKFPEPPRRKTGLWQGTNQSDQPGVEGKYEICPGEGAPPVNEQDSTAYEAAKKSCRVAERRGSDGSFITDVTCNLANQRMSFHTVDAYPSATHTHERLEM